MFKDRPFLGALVWLLVIAIVGAACGVAWGIFEADSIAQKAAAENPSDPLDMLHMVVWTYVVLGFVGGALTGLLVASLVYLTKKNELADLKAGQQGIKS